MLKPVSEKDIEPVHVICPVSMQCQTMSCNQRSIHMDTRDRDVPRVTLIKGTKIYDRVHVLSGKCPTCETKYYADHESSQNNGVQHGRTRFYLNSAKYLKVGQSIWVDRVFSGAVIMQLTAFMLPQQHLLNSGMIASGQLRKPMQERLLDDSSGIPMCRNLFEEFQNPLGIL